MGEYYFILAGEGKREQRLRGVVKLGFEGSGERWIVTLGKQIYSPDSCTSITPPPKDKSELARFAQDLKKAYGAVFVQELSPSTAYRMQREYEDKLFVTVTATGDDSPLIRALDENN